ncbi:hypothetical protein CKA32_007165 [Geitlerinema sp. FC II]|nr:hypothetical protein CKA32_007165 [Geitlerinema sp. FC II]
MHYFSLDRDLAFKGMTALGTLTEALNFLLEKQSGESGG